MKKILIWAVLILAALFAYNYFQTPSSPDMQAVEELSEQFSQAVREFSQAGKSAAIGGVDTSAAAEAAVDRIEEIRSRLQNLRVELEEEPALRKADALMEKIRTFLNQNS